MLSLKALGQAGNVDLLRKPQAIVASVQGEMQSHAGPAGWREAKARVASANKGAWPQVRTDQLLCVSETWNCAGIHLGKSKHARQKGQS